MRPYDEQQEQIMKEFYNSLSEKDRRRYAGSEALRQGPGGQNYIARVLRCSRNTVRRGAREVSNLPSREVDQRIREPGGGRHRYDETYPDIEAQFLDVLKEYTAGDPMDDQVVWTDLTPREIGGLLEQHHQVRVSKSVIYKLLEKHHYRRRKAQKKKTQKSVAQRDAQLAKISALIAEFRAVGNPIISFDTKKKEYVGNFYREGHLYTRETLQTDDHDFTSHAEGIIIPHGIYDLQRNMGYLHLGLSKDTSEFACDCIRSWWHRYGGLIYPQATAILALCDGGGSNNTHFYIFKEDLQKLADELGIEIRMAHYPPYCSKYNPIEHRLFPHVTRACQGVIFTRVALVKELMEKTKTSTGLKVIVEIIEKTYQTGRKVAEDFKMNMRIVFDDHLPHWNYRAIPLPLCEQVV